MATEETFHTFRCPTCEEELAVNAPMRDALIEHGCVICGTAVDTSDFVTRQRDCE